MPRRSIRLEPGEPACARREYSNPAGRLQYF